MLFRSINQSLKLQKGVLARMYSEGATGAPRPAGSSDAFSKREKAQEDLYVKQHEKEQLAQLREQLKKQQSKIDSLEEKLDSLSK